MAKTYRISIEYTTLNDMDASPAGWDWWDLLGLNPAREAVSVTVEKLDTNTDHVDEIMAENDFSEEL